jgi:hypothetical protein
LQIGFLNLLWITTTQHPIFGLNFSNLVNAL